MAALTFDDLEEEKSNALTFDDIPETPGLFGRIKNDYNERVANDRESLNAYKSGEQSLASTGLQLLGQGAGLVSGIPANIIGSAARSAYDLITPRGAKELHGQATEAVMGSRPVQATTGAIAKGIDYAKTNYPVTTRNAAALGNIASAFGTVKVAENVIPKVSSKLYASGKQAFDAKRFDAVQNVVLPKETPKQIERTALQRQAKGLFNKQVYVPTEREKSMIAAAAQAGVKPKAPIEKNLQILSKANKQEALRLQSALAQNPVPIDPATLNSAYAKIIDGIATNPLVEENGATVRKLLEAAEKHIAANPKTAAGLLQARKDFDRAVEAFQPSALDTDAPATAFRYTTKQIRQGINDIIAQSNPDEAVRASLAKQSQLYEAIDNLSGKLPAQPTSGPARFMQTKKGKALKYGVGAAATYGAGNAVVNAIKGNQQ